MKSFEQFIESSAENVGRNTPEVSHTHYLGQIGNMIEEKNEKIKGFVELNSELTKIFLEIKRTLEYGIKEESKIKDAVNKAIGLAEMGGKLRSTDFSSWSKMTGSGNYHTRTG
jgi:hypothetical protein